VLRVEYPSELKVKIEGKEWLARLGKVHSVQFGIDDRDRLSFNLNFDFWCCGQSLTPTVLAYNRFEDGKICTFEKGSEFLLRVLRLFKTVELRTIQGRYCYCLYKDGGLSDPIKGLLRVEHEYETDELDFVIFEELFG